MKAEATLVRLDTVAPDPRYVEMVESYKKRPELAEVVGSLSVSLDKSGVMNLVSDIIRSRTKADFGLYNWGGIRVDSLSRGDIRLVDIYSIEPFGNTVHVVKMTEADIKEIILNKFNSTGKESHRADLYPSGFSYRVRTDHKGEGIDVIFDTNAKPSAGGYYRVAMSDYVATAYNFKAAGTGEPTGIIVAPLIMEYFRKNSPVTGDNTPRVTIGK